MAAKLGIPFFSVALFCILLQAAEARILLQYNSPIAIINGIESPAAPAVLPHLILQLNKYSSLTHNLTIYWLRIPRLSSETENQEAGRAYSSFPSVKLEIESRGISFMAPPRSSANHSLLQVKSILVIIVLLLLLISSATSLLIRMICTRNVGPMRPAREEISEPRPIAVGGQHIELTICKCDVLSLFTSSI